MPPLLRSLAALAAALVLSPACLAACDAPRVSYNILPFEPREDFSLSYSRLFRVDPEGTATGDVGNVAVYLVHEAVARRDDKGCWTVAVTAGYRDPVLRVAKEVAANACALRHVKEHEEKHLQFYRESLATLAQRIDLRIASAAASLPSDERDASRELASLVEAEVVAVRSRHRELDSIDEYARNAKVCNGIMGRLFVI